MEDVPVGTPIDRYGPIPMDPTARFRELVLGPDRGFALDEAMLCIAAHARRDLDVIGELARLDELAASCPAPTFERLLRHLFTDEGFRGDTDEYDAPSNSYLDRVLDRRRGIPISLSVLTMEVGRRLGLDVRGVGMPGHFLVSCDGRLADPFGGGRLLEVDDAATLFRAATGSAAPFDPGWLAPTDPVLLLVRVLNNLKASFLRRGDAVSLAWCLRLRVGLPGVPASESAELTRVMARFN